MEKIFGSTVGGAILILLLVLVLILLIFTFRLAQELNAMNRRYRSLLKGKKSREAIREAAKEIMTDEVMKNTRSAAEETAAQVAAKTVEETLSLAEAAGTPSGAASDEADESKGRSDSDGAGGTGTGTRKTVRTESSGISRRKSTKRPKGSSKSGGSAKSGSAISRMAGTVRKAADTGGKTAGNEKSAADILRSSGFQKTLDSLKENESDISEQIRALGSRYSHTLCKYGIVKYDAFDDVGGKLSFALAVLDSENSGFVLDAIHSRDNCFLYLKEIVRGESYIMLSEEEIEALKQAAEGHDEDIA